MTASYWIAKYVEDPFRNEPRNVGVIVSLNGVVWARFVGEREDGTIDQRKLRGFTYPAVYSQWREFWRKQIGKRDLEAITRAITANFFVETGGEVSDTGNDNAAEVCHFLYGLLVGAGPLEAFEWMEADDSEVDLASDITEALDHLAVLAREGQLFARHPVVRNENIRGQHVVHKPSFSQRNGRLHVMEHIDLSSRRVNKSKERAGWMAYMFSDIKELDSKCATYSIIRPEGDNKSEQIEYARSVLEGESRIVNWSDAAERNAFLEERRLIAEPSAPGALGFVTA